MKILAIAALAAAASFTAFPTSAGQGHENRHQHRIERTDRHALQLHREALNDARIAAIRAGLRLTAEQEPLFAPVEKALRDMAGRRTAQGAPSRETSGGERAAADFMDRFQMRAGRAAERAVRLEELASAMNPLWASLDDNQQRLLPVLMRDAVGMYRGANRMTESGRRMREHRR